MNRQINIVWMLVVSEVLLAVLMAACVNGAKRSDAKEKAPSAAITVDTTVRYQQVRGFGGMSNAWNSPVITENDVTTMYGEDGLGYNIFRIIIYHEPARWGELLAVAKKAQSYGATIVASPWTPPIQLKSVKSHIGGYLLPGHYADYAAHLRSFVRYMADNGVKIDAISFQNEPDIQVSYDSCDWTSRQMLEFVKSYGREIGDVKIIPGESFQFRRNFTDPMLNDPDALKNFDIIGGHIYGGGLMAYPLAAQKGKEVWMTEHLLNTQGNFPNDLTWQSAMIVAKEIHDCMTANFNVYLWWYLKRFYSMIGDGEYGAVEGRILRRGYVMSHYAQYATGKQRVEARVDGNRNVYASAYDGGSGLTLVIVNMGIGSSDATIQLPANITKASAVESVESGAMRTKPVRLDFSEKTTARLMLAPQSIVSVQFE
jgi:O-glycosyl hydrolase